MAENDDEDFEVWLPSEGNELPTMMYAPTTNPSRPRALSIGYDKKLKILYILFREATSKSPALWQYEQIDNEVWKSLKNSDSTGGWLRQFDYDNWPYKGPVEAGSISLSRQRMVMRTYHEVGSERYKDYGYENIKRPSVMKIGNEDADKVQNWRDRKVAQWYAENNPEKGRQLGIL